MALASAAEVPRASPDFAIDMPGGKQVTVGQYKGKILVLAFIRTSCPHCQRTVGYLTALQNEYSARGVQVIASATDEMAGMLVPDFIKQFKPSFPVGFSRYDSVVQYLQHDPMFKLYAPQLVFIDRQGAIRAQYEGGDKFFVQDQEKHLHEQVDTLLKQ